MQKAEHADTARCSHVHSAVGNHRRDELIPCAKVIVAAGRLIAVIQLVQVSRIVSVQDCRIRVFDGPDDSIRVVVRRDARYGARIPKTVARLRHWCSRKLRIRKLEGIDGAAYGSIINRAVEIGGHSPDSAWQRSCKLL